MLRANTCPPTVWPRVNCLLPGSRLMPPTPNCTCPCSSHRTCNTSARQGSSLTVPACIPISPIANPLPSSLCSSTCSTTSPCQTPRPRLQRWTAGQITVSGARPTSSPSWATSRSNDSSAKTTRRTSAHWSTGAKRSWAGARMGSEVVANGQLGMIGWRRGAKGGATGRECVRRRARRRTRGGVRVESRMSAAEPAECKCDRKQAIVPLLLSTTTSGRLNQHC